MKTYKLHSGMNQQFVIDVERNAFIPFDPANTDFAQFKLDLAEGVSLQDAEGNEMTAEQIADFLKTLP